MLDKLDLIIPLLPGYFDISQTGEHGWLNVTYKDLDLAFTANHSADGDIIRTSHNPFDNPLHSSLSAIYYKVYDKGSMARPFPYLSLKCSPAKVMQGHNVFGSDDIEIGFFAMLNAVKQKLPKLFNILDVLATKLQVLDINYFTKFENELQGNQIIKFLSNISDGQVKATNSMENETIYWNKSSNHQSGQLVERKAYLKFNELKNYIKKVKKFNLPKETISQIVAILEQKRLQEFTKNMLRFEVSIKAKYIKQQYKDNTIINIIDEQKKDKCFNKKLFQYGFEKIFQTIGNKKMIIKNTEKIKEELEELNIKTIEIDRAISLYKILSKYGWYDTKKDYGSKASFYRHLATLTRVLPKAQLQNLNSQESGNVVPLIQFVNLDFGNQFPDWYEAPTLDSLGLRDFADSVYNNKPILKAVNG